MNKFATREQFDPIVIFYRIIIMVTETNDKPNEEHRIDVMCMQKKEHGESGERKKKKSPKINTTCTNHTHTRAHTHMSSYNRQTVVWFPRAHFDFSWLCLLSIEREVGVLNFWSVFLPSLLAILERVASCCFAII